MNWKRNIFQQCGADTSGSFQQAPSAAGPHRQTATQRPATTKHSNSTARSPCSQNCKHMYLETVIYSFNSIHLLHQVEKANMTGQCTTEVWYKWQVEQSASSARTTAIHRCTVYCQHERHKSVGFWLLHRCLLSIYTPISVLKIRC